MPISNLTATQLKSALKLLEKRDKLLAEAKVINERINSLEGDSPLAVISAKRTRTKSIKVKAPKASKPRRKSKRTRRVDLKGSIFTALKNAGKTGLTVKELTAQLKANRGSVNTSLYNSLKAQVAGLSKGKDGKFVYKGE